MERHGDRDKETERQRQPPPPFFFSSFSSVDPLLNRASKSLQKHCGLAILYKAESTNGKSQHVHTHAHTHATVRAELLLCSAADNTLHFPSLSFAALSASDPIAVARDTADEDDGSRALEGTMENAS